MFYCALAIIIDPIHGTDAFKLIPPVARRGWYRSRLEIVVKLNFAEKQKSSIKHPERAV
jgi:hypothetical protein